MMLSIIIPVFNSEKYLPDLFACLTQNNLKNTEIIFVDDSSTDNSYATLMRFSKTNDIIKVVRNEKNIGSGPSRNIGISLAKGSYITFIDADDLISKNYIERIQHIIQSYSPDYIAMKKSSNNESLTEEYDNDVIFEDKSIYIKKYISSGAHSFSVVDKIFKSEHIKLHNIHFDNIKYSEDILFLVKYLSVCGDKYIFADKHECYIRRWNDSSTIGSCIKNYFDKNIEYVKILENMNIDDVTIDSLVLRTGICALYRISQEKDYSSLKENSEELQRIFKNRRFKNAIKHKEYKVSKIIKILIFFGKIKFYLFGCFISHIILSIQIKRK